MIEQEQLRLQHHLTMLKRLMRVCEPFSNPSAILLDIQTETAL